MGLRIRIGKAVNAIQHQPAGSLAPYLAGMSPCVREREIAVRLYPKVSCYQPQLAGEITNMLLEMKCWELVLLLEAEHALEAMVERATRVLIGQLHPNLIKQRGLFGFALFVKLFPMVYQHEPALAGRISKTIMEMVDDDELCIVLQSEHQLKAKVDELVQLFEANPCRVTVSNLNGELCQLTVDQKFSWAQVKALIHHSVSIPVEEQKLFIDTEEVPDSVLVGKVSSYNESLGVTLVRMKPWSRFDFSEDLTGMSLAEQARQKQTIGEALYRKIAITHKRIAPEITGVILEMPISEILNLLESEFELGAVVDDVAYELRNIHTY